MSKDKNLFTVAGTSTSPAGETKVRFANDLVSRIKILQKTGHSNIELAELPRPMTKLEAVEWLKAQPATSPAAAEAIDSKWHDKKQQASKLEIRVSGSIASTADSGETAEVVAAEDRTHEPTF